VPAASSLDLETRWFVTEEFNEATSRQGRAFLELTAFGDIVTSMDSFGRVIDYLRISVTDRCNERCLYCMPEGYKGWAQKADHLTADEIVRVVAAASRLGFRKFRLTGGEPCIRKDLVQIAHGISQQPGVGSLGISTNGTQLGKLARPLQEAGVTSVNISLDTLDAAQYRKITGGDIGAVLSGIDAAVSAGISRIKLNCVLMRGINEAEIWPLIRFAARRNLPLRFIELMPISTTHVLTNENFLSAQEVMDRLSQDDKLLALENSGLGHGPARYYQLLHTGATVGFIGALTDADFCAGCNKIRLTADGRIRPCLGRHNELDLIGTLRHSHGSIEEVLERAIAAKPKDHEFRDCYQPGRPMTAIGG
jgi:cyclic pyranopterin phosphate synthase